MCETIVRKKSLSNFLLIMFSLISCIVHGAAESVPFFHVENFPDYDEVLFARNSASPIEDSKPNKFGGYTVVLGADQQMKISGTPSELKVWIGSSSFIPEFPSRLIQDATNVPALGESATVELFAPAFDTDPAGSQCIKIHPSGSAALFKLLPKESGIFDVSAVVNLFDSPDCSGFPISETTATLKITVEVDQDLVRNKQSRFRTMPADKPNFPVYDKAIDGEEFVVPNEDSKMLTAKEYYPEKSFARNGGSPTVESKPNKFGEYTVVLGADKQMKIPGIPGELRVWIGSSSSIPDFPSRLIQDATSVPALGESATVEPFAPAFDTDPAGSQCIKIHPSGSAALFKLIPKESGTFDVSAVVNLFDSPDCSGSPIPKTTATLKVTVEVDQKEIFADKVIELWNIFWKKLLEFWAALVALIFGLILFLIKGKLKQ